MELELKLELELELKLWQLPLAAKQSFNFAFCHFFPSCTGSNSHNVPLSAALAGRLVSCFAFSLSPTAVNAI